MKHWKTAGCALLCAALLCACGPKKPAADASSQGAASSPDSASASLPQPEESSPQPAPQASCGEQWLERYGAQVGLLGKSLPQAADAAALSYVRMPGGEERVYLDQQPLLFSTLPRADGASCVAVSAWLGEEELLIPDLRREWEDTLVFVPDDPLAGPCWVGRAGEVTLRFLTDEQGVRLRGTGNDLVLSRDGELPPVVTDSWLEPLPEWTQLWVEEPGVVWKDTLGYAAALGSNQPPQGARDQADGALMESLYALRGLKNPDTGVQYFAYGEGEDAPWDAVAVPVGLLLGYGLPLDMGQVVQTLDTPFSWGMYSETGYWFYVGGYKVLLTSDGRGSVTQDSLLLISPLDFVPAGAQ